MDEQEAQKLIEKYQANNCTQQEIAVVESWLLQRADRNLTQETAEDDDSLKTSMWAVIASRPVKHRLPVYIRYAAAAAVVVMVAGVWFFNSKKEILKQVQNDVVVKDIPAGTNKAVLTLANGTSINLSDAVKGTIANQSGVAITKNASGQIVYTLAPLVPVGRDGKAREGETAYNTITTPNGGQYQIILPDGSHVYLNATSSLKYPVSFTKEVRKVELTGEGYFEITKNPKKPFVVTSQGQLLTVLGTHFNISAYPNEAIKTTLSEGSVQLSNSSSLKKQILQPEQQALLTETGFELKHVNSTDEMAWKDGLFVFKQTPIEAVMRQLSRWYSVEANWNNLPDITVAAELSRTLTLTRMLKGINFGIRNEGFKIELKDGRRLEISKN
jgi:ferric-dicitrate binding protein FerR (iron transport regulator)